MIDWLMNPSPGEVVRLVNGCDPESTDPRDAGTVDEAACCSAPPCSTLFAATSHQRFSSAAYSGPQMGGLPKRRFALKGGPVPKCKKLINREMEI